MNELTERLHRQIDNAYKELSPKCSNPVILRLGILFLVQSWQCNIGIEERKKAQLLALGESVK